MKSDVWNRLRPLGTALLVLVLLNIGLYSLLPPPRGSTLLDRPRSILLDFSEAHPGTGWYQPETTGDGITFQWTSAVDATLSYAISIRDPLEVLFRIVNGEQDDIAGIQLTVNQTAIPLTRDDDQFSGVIPLSVVTAHPESLDLDFHTPRVYRPADLHPGSTDTRTLGVAFDWLILRPQPDNTTLYEFDDGCTRDKGWYGTETDPGDGSTFCWTAATDALMTVHVPRGKPFTLEVGLMDAISPEVLSSFRLEINGVTLQTQQTSHAGRLYYTVNVAPLDADSADVTFHVDQVLSPASGGSSTDTRTLGVRVDWLRITENS